MKKKWIRVVPRTIHHESVPGEFLATTSNGRKIYCYSSSSEEAFKNALNALKDREYILSIGRY
jgi:hypothetical protein